jgi:GntP family gluconate:H+ symporter
MSVLMVAGFGVLAVLVGILGLRLHPFLALLLGTWLVLGLTPRACLLRQEWGDAGLLVRQVDERGRLLLSSLPAGGEYRLWRLNAEKSLPGGWLLAVEEPGESQSAWVLAKRLSADGEAEEPPIRRGDLLVPKDRYDSAEATVRRTAWSGITKRLAAGLAATFQKIGLPIAMAAIIGVCLLESGAAARLVQGLGRCFGSSRTAPALMVSGFVLGVPVYFDTVFYLLLPIAKAYARLRPGVGLLAVMSIIVGATMAHSLVPPTPGPLLVATRLGIPLGTMMLGGLVVGGSAAVVGYWYALWCNRHLGYRLFESSEPTAASEPTATSIAEAPLAERAGQPRELPMLLAALPLVIPIGCLGGIEIGRSLCGTSGNSPFAPTSAWVGILDLWSDPGFVLMVAAVVALLILRLRLSARQTLPLMTKAIADAGTIVLLTCAGGAFGAALEQLQLAEAVTQLSQNFVTSQGLLLAAFLLTGGIRVAQGSATVAMITAVGIVAPFVQSDSLPFHPVYVALAIGCGSKLLPWMNDSGFWQVSSMVGLTTTQTLRTFSTALSLMGCVGFALTLLGSWLLPMAGR